MVFADTATLVEPIDRTRSRGDRSPLRAWLHRARPLRRLRDRARSVDAPVARTDADASLCPRRCRRHPALCVGAKRGRGASDNGSGTVLGIPRTGHTLGLLHSATEERIRLERVHHLVVAHWLRHVHYGPRVGSLALLTAEPLPFEARSVAIAVLGNVEVASLRRLAVRRDHHDLDVQRPALDGAIQLVFVAGDHGGAARGVHRRAASTGAAHARQAAFCGHGDRIVVPIQPWRWIPQGARGHAIPG